MYKHTHVNGVVVVVKGEAAVILHTYIHAIISSRAAGAREPVYHLHDQLSRNGVRNGVCVCRY